jgi:hypothetical protein
MRHDEERRAARLEVEDPAEGRRIDCIRCRIRMKWLGRREFHEGTNWGLLGTIGELFVNCEAFELYRCPKCGKVEFFVGGEDPGPTPP